MSFLGLGLFAYPLILGILLVAAGHHFSVPVRKWAVAISVGIILACILISFLLTDAKLHLPLEWWPGSGALYFKFEFWGLVAAYLTTLTGLVFYLAETKQHHLSCWQEGLFLLVLTTANSAFLAGNFLLRYAALEFAALGIAVVQLLAVDSRSSQRLYLGFRLADAGLLIAIILLIYSGTSLEINEALNMAVNLPANILQWAAAGFVLAVWVKAGAWPFVFWQNACRETSSPIVQSWFLGTVMPHLGLYLLYRTVHLVVQAAFLQDMISLLAGISALAAVVLLWQKSAPKERGVWLSTFLFAILIFAAINRMQILIWGGMLIAVILRLLSLEFITPKFFGKTAPKWVQIISGGFVILFAFIILWSTQGDTRFKIDLWFAEASLALLILWLIKVWKEMSILPGVFAAVNLPGHGTQRSNGFTGLLLVAIILPLFFSPLHTQEISPLLSIFAQDRKSVV